MKLTFLGLAALLALSAQDPAVPPFAAASVKQSKPRIARIMTIDFLRGGRLQTVDLPLRMIVANAYGLPYGSPFLKWSDPLLEQAYDIDAVAEPGAIPIGASKDENDRLTRLMLRQLLESRFHLKMRTERKEEPVYAIEIGGQGLKLSPAAVEPKDCGTETAKDITCHRIDGGWRSGLRADACSMADLAAYLSSQAGRLVIDRTGLTGLFQIKTSGWLDLMSESEDPAGQRQAASLTAIFKAMGLKLEPQHALVEILTVESITQPSEN